MRKKLMLKKIMNFGFMEGDYFSNTNTIIVLLLFDEIEKQII